VRGFFLDVQITPIGGGVTGGYTAVGTVQGQPGDIWSGFSQSPVGNCITVSAIKVAMMHVGQKPTDVFKEVKYLRESRRCCSRQKKTPDTP
jgi:hypothetical protein